MSPERRYLRPSVKLEPLFHGWYAWSHLVAPHTAAMHVANGHVKIMGSYLAAPQVHAAAVRNPAMLGAAGFRLFGKMEKVYLAKPEGER